MNKYQIFTDATADLNEELMKGLPEVKIIPMEIRIDQTPYIYGPGGNIDHELFYSILDTQKEVMTSGINPEVYESYFEEALKEGKDVLYICFTSGLSSTYNTARIIVRELDEKYPDRKIYCLNSYCASIGEAFIVYEAAKRQSEGMGFDELIDYTHNERFNVSHWSITFLRADASRRLLPRLPQPCRSSRCSVWMKKGNFMSLPRPEAESLRSPRS